MDIKRQEEIAKKSELSQSDYTEVFEHYYPRVLNFIKARVTKAADAEDIASLVFEKILKKLADFQWQGISLTSWIFRIARNAIIDFYRKNSERRKDASIELVGDFLVSEDTRIEALVADSEEEVALYKAMQELNEEDQYLVYYKFFEELPNREIAKLTGLSDTNVGTKLHRIRTKLKQKVNRNLNAPAKSKK